MFGIFAIASLLNNPVYSLRKFISLLDNFQPDIENVDDFITNCISQFNLCIQNCPLEEFCSKTRLDNNTFSEILKIENCKDSKDFILKQSYAVTQFIDNFFITLINKSNNLSTEIKEYLKYTINGIIYGDKTYFEKAYEINSNYTMANLNLFLYYFNEMQYSSGQIKQNNIIKMTEHLDELNQECKEHILIEGTQNIQYICTPYVKFNFKNDKTNEFIMKNYNTLKKQKTNNEEINYHQVKEKINKSLAVKKSFPYAYNKDPEEFEEISEEQFDFLLTLEQIDNHECNEKTLEFLNNIMFNIIPSKEKSYNNNRFINHRNFLKLVKKYYQGTNYPALFASNNSRITSLILLLPNNTTISKSDFDNSITIAQKNLELSKLNKQLEETIAKLEQERKEKMTLINDNAHDWTHIVYHNIVFNVAKNLYENESQRENALKLFEANNSETLLVNNLNLLKTEYISSKKDFRYDLQDSFCSPRYKDSLSFLNILNYSLKIVLSKILLEDFYSEFDDVFSKNNREPLQKKYIDNVITKEISKIDWFSKNNREHLQKKYIDNIKKETSTIDWFSKNIYPINIQNICSNIHVKKDELGFFLLVNIFINLINNAINYGVKTKAGYLNFNFSTDETYHILSISNPMHRESSFMRSKKEGLNSVNSKLKKFNNNEDNLLINEQDNIFEITIKFDSEILGG